MLKDLKKHRRFFLIAAGVLFLSFSLNIFGAVKTDDFLHNYKDSEALVANQIACKGKAQDGQLLVRSDPAATSADYSCNQKKLRPYSSQYGLQGRVYTQGYEIVSSVVSIPPRAYVAIAQLSTALVSALCLAALALWARSRFGRIPAVTFVIMVAISPMIVGFSRNLYWTLPLLFLPFIYALYAYGPDAARPKKTLFWSVLGVLLYLRYLTGYEFITTITIMVAAAIGYHLFVQKNSKKTYVKEIALVAGVSILGFAAALGTHLVSLQETTGSMGKAAEVIKARALERTTNAEDYLPYAYSGFQLTSTDLYRISDSYVGLESRAQGSSQMWASIVSFVNYALLPVVNIPVALNQPFGAIIQSVGVFSLLLAILFIMRMRLLPKHLIHTVNALFLGALIGLAGYLSWLLLARSHSIVHAHINGILVYMPFALFGFMLIGIYLQAAIARVKQKYALRTNKR